MKLAFISKQRETENIYSFWFKPAEPTVWLAGQSIRLEIGEHERRFSIVSAPFEKNIIIATKISDSIFKQLLIKLQPGELIDGFNIEGTFTWKQYTTKRIMFASGVGITPYISMFRQLHYDKQRINATLVYANHDKEFLFGEELKGLEHQHPELIIDFLAGERLSQKVINIYASELTQSLVYLSGPESMVNKMKPLLFEAGVKKDKLKLDIFTGRTGWED